MIEIPEERLLSRVKDILSDEFPRRLRDIEERVSDAVRLPPFRYISTDGKLPPGTPLPFAIISLEAWSPEVKDRIIRNILYSVCISYSLCDPSLVWRYNQGIRESLDSLRDEYRLRFTNNPSDFRYRFIVVSEY